MDSQSVINPRKYALVEEERRFLLKSLPGDLEPEKSYVRIVDHYISGTRLRLRRMEAPSGEVLAYKFGQKYKTEDQLAHQTFLTNIYLDEDEYRVMAALKGAKIVKRRYPYLYDVYKCSLDAFEGHLKGLVLLEIQRHSGIDITEFPVPVFAIRDVTDDPRFTGGKLAARSQLSFQQWLLSWS